MKLDIKSFPTLSQVVNAAAPKVLFRIRSKDFHVIEQMPDGTEKPITFAGGEEYDVIGFEEGKYYVTTKFYKRDIPQLIPWHLAERI